MKMKIRNFHRAVQSNNVDFAGFNHMKFCYLSIGFLLIYTCKPQQIYVSSISKRDLYKTSIFRSSILTLGLLTLASLLYLKWITETKILQDFFHV